MKSLLRYLKNYKKETALAPIFKMMEAVFDLLVPLVVASIIDKGISHKDTTYVLKMGGVLVLLAGVGLTLVLIAQYFAAKAAAGFGKELRHDLFGKIQSMSFAQLDRQGTSTLITRMTTDVSQVQAQVNMAIRLVLRSPFIVLGAIIMAFLVDAKTALVFVAATIVLILVVFGIMLITIPMYRKVQAGLDRVVLRTRENLSGVRVLRAFNKQDEEVAGYTAENQMLYHLQIVAGKISQIMNPATYVVVNLAIIGILWFGGHRVYDGKLSQGQVVALLNYMSQILIELIKLAALIINLVKAFACASRIEEVLKMDTGMKEGTYTGECINEISDVIVKTKNTETGKNQFERNQNIDDIIISFEHAGLDYNNSGEESVSDVNLQIKRGQTIGIIGGTGAGKTTLVNMIPRFYDATSGTVKVDGIDVKDYRTNSLRKKIAIVPQKSTLFRGTVKSNLLWGNADATDEELICALKQAQAYDFVMENKDGLDCVVEKQGDNFSGGQKQRLSIARALVRKPEILILDDSSSALDYATDAALQKELGKLHNVTKLVVSQRTSSIMNADRIIVLDDGAVIGIGTHDKLIRECEIYRDIYESQFKKEGK